MLAFIVVSLLSATAQAQSLADLARRERARKQGLEGRAILNASTPKGTLTGSTVVTAVTTGMIVTASALLHEVPNPTDNDIKRYLSGNLCRCTGYLQQVEAVKLAYKKLATHR